MSLTVDGTGTEVNTQPVDAPESVTKDLEDAFYSEPNKVEEVEPEKTTLVSEDPIEDEVTKTEEVKSEDDPGKQEEAEEKEEGKEGEVTYELELQEESYLDTQAIEDIKAFAMENKLSNEAAQTMLKREEDAVANFIQDNEEAIDSQIGKWRDEIVADKVLGGGNLEATKANSRRVVERFGTEGFIEILNTTGYGNHPEVVSFLNGIGALMGEDSLISGKSEAKPEKALHEYFYN